MQLGKIYEAIDERLAAFIAAQKLFFVATAPLSPDGHVNLSPKGYDTFAILDPRTVAYLDIGGSGAETMAHLRENGRITFLFCAFEGPAKILRLYGRGESFAFDEPEFAELSRHFPDLGRARNIIRVRLTRIADSCGWGVPFYEFRGERDQLLRANAHRTDAEWREKRYATNAESIDGLPALARPAQSAENAGD
ncbi:MAG: pyridoxamine 5'-phosphate oxidase family protein [Parvularculaceae bacterium]